MFDMDDIFRTTEAPDHGVFFQLIGEAGGDPQTVVFRINAQNGLGNAQEGPAGGAGEPAVFGVTGIAGSSAGDHLGIAVGLGFVDLGFVFQVSRADSAVDVEGLVAPAQLCLGADDPGVVVTENGAVFLESGRVGGDFTKLQMIFCVSGIQ